MENCFETVLPEVAKSYRRMMELLEPRTERTTGTLPLIGRPDRAVSIIEREHDGSDSYAVIYYEVGQTDPEAVNFFDQTLADGRTERIRALDTLFTNRCDYDKLHALCGMIETTLDDQDLLCDR